jgi:molybdopterin converting factor small subunit
LRDLATRHDATFQALLLDESCEPRKTLLFFIGDEHADLSRPLVDGDTITILAPMSGG